MKQKYVITLFLQIVFTINVQSQNYNVSTFQKINETNGNFSIALDNEDNFGISNDYIGDLNGDGYEDLVVGAYTDDDGGVNRGAIYILFLDDNNMVISETKISDTQGGFLGVLDNDDRFGGAVSYLGDLNNDGLIEIAVGADYDGDGGFWHGAVWILSLNSNGTVNSHSKISDTQGGFNGFINGDAIFGTDIENIGDLNGDGIDDLAVGSRRDGDGGARKGAVWILFMNANLTVNTEQKISDTQGGFNGVLQFEDYFGGSIANLGDLDGDGITDIAVGAYRDDDGQQNSGSLYVLFLNTNGTVKSQQKVSNSQGGLTTPISSEALFGESIDGVVDIDGDGKIEIIVGAMKQVNPTLAIPTGAFFIVELNSNGTVSEDYLYTYNEFCFSGQLNVGDLFGGSVSVSNTGTTLNSITVGAYRDSENGYRKGAIWVLELGGASNFEVSQVNPSVCGSQDGTIIFSNFIPNESYIVSFEHDGQSEVWIFDADNAGDVVLTNLNIGFYTNINISQSNNLTCSYNLADVQLVAENWSLDFTVNSNAQCGAANGSILISNLAPNTSYVFDYEFNGVTTSGGFTSDSNGEWIITGLASGDYEFIMVVDNLNPCTDGIGLLTVGNDEVNVEIDIMNPTACGEEDGSIIFENLTVGLNYTISYTLNGNTIIINETADAVAQIVINLLGAGVYENIVITEDLSSCSQNFDNMNLTEPNLDYVFSQNSTTICGESNASILISGLEPNRDYNVSYNFNGSMTSSQFMSNDLGEIIVEGLEAGSYENIMVLDIVGNCSYTETLLVLSSSDFEVILMSTSPLNCTKPNGSLVFSNLIAGNNYNLSYNFEAINETLNVIANSNGEISIYNLSAGIYSLIEITDITTGCSNSLEDVVLNEPEFNINLSVGANENCGSNNGSIQILNLVVNESYEYSYEYDSNTFQSSFVATTNNFFISNLEAGDYMNITITRVSTACEFVEPLIVINEEVINLSLSSDDASSCQMADAKIIISNLDLGTTYLIAYTHSSVTSSFTFLAESSGTYVIEALNSGVYLDINVMNTATGCSINFEAITLECVEVDASKCFDTKMFFTPNGDGINDYWSLERVSQDCEYKIYIYDRFGKLLVVLKDKDKKWDGTYNGFNMPTNDYWYIVEYKKDNTKTIYKSHFTLKR